MISSGIPLLLWQIPRLDDSRIRCRLPHSPRSECLGEDDAVTEPEEDEPESTTIDGRPRPGADRNRVCRRLGAWFSEGKEKGYAEGVAAGADAAQAALEATALRLQAIIAQLGKPISALDAWRSKRRLPLWRSRSRAASSAVKPRGHAITWWASYARRLQRCRSKRAHVKVVLNPADIEIIRRLAPQIEEDGAVLVSDDTIEPGDCRVVADGQNAPIKDMRWRPRPGDERLAG